MRMKEHYSIAIVFFFVKGENMGEVYGYIRVSSRDQNEDRQLIAMREVPIPEKNIYIDKQSGKDFNRPMYRKVMHCENGSSNVGSGKIVRPSFFSGSDLRFFTRNAICIEVFRLQRSTGFPLVLRQITDVKHK